MKTAIKIIKPRKDEQVTPAPSKPDMSVEQSTRKMTHTIKTWIAELQQRKRSQGYSEVRQLGWPLRRAVQNS